MIYTIAFAVSISFQQVQLSRLLYDQACSSYLIKCFISGAMEPKEKKGHACNDLICILSGVARMKQLCSRRQGNGFVVYASLCNVCKNMNLCVFIYVSALISSSSIVLLNSYSSIEFICRQLSV